MGKGSVSKQRWNGNGLQGKRAEPFAGEMTPEQVASVQSGRESRSMAARRGHQTRRARETERLLDFLAECIERGTVDQAWASLTDHQRALVDAWLEQDRARERAIATERNECDR